jgi:hypothetical protein
MSYEQIIAIVLGSGMGWFFGDRIVRMRREIAELRRHVLRLRHTVYPDEFPPEQVSCRCVVRPFPDMADLRRRPYECPICGINDPFAHIRCNRPDCTDGRDPR